ncbi:MAG: peptidase MA family metallohydrolase [Terriglobales bacterium]
MRVFVTFFLPGIICLLAALPTQAPAEIIHLKNGRTISADHVEQNGAHLEYEIGEESFAIPSSSVDHVEAGGAPGRATTTPPESVPNVASFSPPAGIGNAADLSHRVIVHGTVDSDALAQLENGDPSVAAAGYYIAGKNEFEHGNFGKSRSDFERALHFDPQNPAILNYYAAVLIRTGNASQALTFAERATRYASDSPDAWAVLGYAQFATDRGKEAIISWKRSLSLRPDARLQEYLQKAERESSVEADYSERETSHFTLRYEGTQTSESLRAELISTLESEYNDLVREFGVAPRNSIPVILYTDQAFFDVTQAPSWSGAVNDGKLRIPVHGITSVTPELARVLKHELAHSFINQLSEGRCPQWLNEGLAQAMEPKSLSSNGSRLARLFQSEREIPFNSLEGSFMGFSPPEAALAYDESLAAVQYINQTYGMSDLQRILARIGDGSSPEAALRATIHSDYGDLEVEVGKYLTATYGN